MSAPRPPMMTPELRANMLASVRGSMALSGIDITQDEAETAFADIEREWQLWEPFSGQHVGNCSGSFRVICECGAVVVVAIGDFCKRCPDCGREYQVTVTVETRQLPSDEP